MAEAQINQPALEDRLAEAVTRLEESRRLSSKAALDGKDFDHRTLVDAQMEVEALGDAVSEQVRLDREAVAVEQLASVAELRAAFVQKEEQRLDAIGRAERATRDQAEALKEVLRVSKVMHGLSTQIGQGGVPMSVNPPSAEMWLAERVACVLKTVVGHPYYFGKKIRFEAAYRREPDDSNWAEGAHKNIAGDLERLMKGKSNGEDSSSDDRRTDEAIDG